MAKRAIRSTSRLTLILSVILGIILLCFAIFLYQRRTCLNVDFLMCLTSKSFVSKTTGLSFRYPSFFPLAQPEGEQKIKQARDSGRIELLDFSKEFFFNAGGDRLGWIQVTKSDFASIDEYEKNLLKPQTVFSSKAGQEISIPPPSVERVRIGNNIEALSVSPDKSLPLLSRNTSLYYFIKDGFMYRVAFNYDNYHHKLPAEQYLKGFELILATLEI